MVVVFLIVFVSFWARLAQGMLPPQKHPSVLAALFLIFDFD
jgi:hypothetical protein